MAINKSERNLVNEFLAQAQPAASALDDRIAARRAARAEAREAARVTRTGRWPNPAAVESVFGPSQPAPGSPGPGRIASGPNVGPGPRPITMPNPTRSTSLARGGAQQAVGRQAASQVLVPDQVLAPRALPPGPAQATPLGPVQATYTRGATAGSPTGVPSLGSASSAASRGAASVADDIGMAAAQAAGGAGRAASTAAQGGMMARYASMGPMMRFGLPAAAGIGASQISSALWDDPNSSADEALNGALTGAGVGAGIGGTVGSVVPGLGTAVGMGLGALGGGLVGGAIGLFGEKNTGTKAVQDEYGAQLEKLDAKLDQFDISPAARESLYLQLSFGMTGLESKDQVKALFGQVSAAAPALIEQDRLERERRSRSAALQAAVMPLLEQSRTDYINSANQAQAAMLAAADQIPNQQIAEMMRARAADRVERAQGYANAALTQVVAAPSYAEAFGVQPQFSVANGAPATDLGSLLEQQLVALGG